MHKALDTRSANVPWSEKLFEDEYSPKLNPAQARDPAIAPVRKPALQLVAPDHRTTVVMK
jgi:hypothetical protein